MFNVMNCHCYKCSALADAVTSSAACLEYCL